MMDPKGAWGLVTGASSGIGREIARDLGARGTNLILVARSKQKLSAIARELTSKHDVNVECIASDCALPGAAQELADASRRFPIRILVNNAGVGLCGSFARQEPSEIASMLHLNMIFSTQLTRLLLPRLIDCAAPTRLMFVGSIAGCQGVPYMAAYAATKAYLNALAEGLTWELDASSLVRVTCILPGKTESGFFDAARMRGSRFVDGNVMASHEVASQAVKAMLKGRKRLVVGRINKLSVFAGRYSPNWLLRRTMLSLFGDLKTSSDNAP